jgi:hypothetical protein
MHQTFYIDIDEEITSIVERLKKARTNEVIIVVPKRALLIQSIVNLRILKKEADENEIQLMIVTQDKLGKVLIEKAGIFVQQKLDNIADGEIDISQEDELEEKAYSSESDEAEIRENQDRLSKIGSQNYFSEITSPEKAKINIKKIKKAQKSEKGEEIKEKLTNKELVVGFGNGQKNSKINLDISKKVERIPVSKILEKEDVVEDEGKKEKIESFFYQKNNFENNIKKKQSNEFKNYNLSSKDHNWFLIFSLISSLVVACILVYLFLPKATLMLKANVKTESIDSSVLGDTSVDEIDTENEIIPAREVSAESVVSESFNSSGNKSVSNQKARGKVVIYNEYSTSPQPLVATTRFLSSGEKLFRLIDGITIPGMEMVAGEMVPGKVEAQVIADEGGESFNIAADKFSIPGFQGSGSEKYNKFYAISTEAMTGGGNGDQTANYITDSDIDEAKAKVLANLKEDIKSKLEAAAGEEVVILDDATEETEPVYKLSNASGDVVDSFNIEIETKAKAVVVAKKDLNSIISTMIAKAKNGTTNIDKDSIELDFGKANVDFEGGILDIKFHAIAEIIPNLSLDEIKKEILGKNNEELASYLSTFSDIREANVEYWPPFMNGQIPSLKSRVEIVLDK